MIFYSAPFIITFLVASIIFNYCKNIKQQHTAILLTSILFYGYWDSRFLALLFAQISICYFAMIKYRETNQRVFVIIPAVFCVTILGIFKYCNFFIASFSQAFGIADPFTLKLFVPLGISFYTFQMLSYIFDVYRGVLPAEQSFLKLAAYLSFFPQITSGPIVKAKDFLPQLEFIHRIKKENIYRGISLFLLGLTKKLVFADRIGVAVDVVFQTPNAYNGISILFAILGYAMQIYCDFSGYSDMAIGVATMWGFDLGKNFNMPYLAKNPSDFWSRWHISLSSWFREYVYIPLGGNRVGQWKTYRNMFTTMLLSGIWHGANWTFILWGGAHALLAVLHKVWQKTGIKLGVSSTLIIITNFICVALLWVPFRANDVGTAISVLSGLIRTSGILYVNVYVVIFLAIMVATHWLAYSRNEGNVILPVLDLDCFQHKLILSVWVLLIVMFSYVGDSAFIYAQF